MKETARNRWLCVVGCLAALAILLSCGGGRERFVLPAGEAHQALSGIDSLMWRQPDNAFLRLQEFASSPLADSLSEFDGHYFQLLLSELLYKNYCEQSNREELLQAVDYLDSVVECGINNSPLVFLDARAHCFNGVGFYEQGNVVQACAEYLNAVEVMEESFDEIALTGERAVFMDIVYSRLLELFSTQFMMDPAIACGDQALAYCQKEPMLSHYIPVIYYHIGKQYDKKGNKDMARNYYNKALEGVSNPENEVYRDITTTKALCEYQVGLELEQSLNNIRQILVLSNNNDELLSRYMTIGAMFFEEGVYDSALRYLEPVFENKNDKTSQIQAANYLRFIYDSIGNQEKSNECTRFLADFKKTEGENKAMVSELEYLFKEYMNQKQRKAAEEMREMSIKNTIGILVPIAIVVALSIIVLAKQKSKKLMKEQQEAAKKLLGETEQEHEKELRLWQSKADKTLEETKKRYEEEVSALEKALDQQHKEAAKQRRDFLNEEICQRILDLVHGKHITSRDISCQHGIGLKEKDCKQLKDAVERHYKGFDNRLLSQCASLKQGDLTLCHLHLLGLNEGEIGALKDRTYSAVKKQNESLQEKIGVEESIATYVLRVADGLCGTQSIGQNEVKDKPIQQNTEEIPQESTLKSTWKNTLKGTQKTIVEMIINNSNVTIPEVAKQLELNPRGIAKHFKVLQDKGVIRRVGPDKGGHWEVVE